MKLVHSSQFTVHGNSNTVNRLPATVNRKAKGFTLIELLIAITIIAILIGLGTYTWINAQEKGRDGKRKNEIKEVQKALELYANLTGRYPPDDGNGNIMCQSSTNPNPDPNIYNATIILWGDPFECTTNSPTPTTDAFMQKLPRDPNSANPQYFYENGLPGDSRTYKISIFLENANDQDRLNLPCTTQSASYNYCVTNP